jgi:hypothetical protein
VAFRTGGLTGGMHALRLRRAAFAVTLASGLGLFGVSLHGMAGVDRTLRAVSAPTAVPQVDSHLVDHHDCHRRRHGGEV